MDYSGDAAALAGFLGAVTTAAPVPAEQRTIRDATATPPTTPGELPALYVLLDGSSLVSGNGVRQGANDYLGRFLLAQAADLSRDSAALMLWASALADALKTHVHLNARAGVALATITGLEVGLVPWSGRSWAGIDVRIHVTTSESWIASDGP